MPVTGAGRVWSQNIRTTLPNTSPLPETPIANSLQTIATLDKRTNSGKTTHPVEIFEIAVYYSRYGLMHTIPASVIEEKPNLDDFISWFKRAAKLVFGDVKEI